MIRPSVFIGSSSEGLAVAEEIRASLSPDADTTIWHEGVFGLGQGTLESLVNALDNFDFAILVLTPDDVIESRALTWQSPRDKVLFECGLFMGRLGQSRTFVVYDKDKNVKLPSDLAGVTVSSYSSERAQGNLKLAVEEACSLIRKAINARGVLSSRKVDGIDLGAAPFKDVFGEDVFRSGMFHLVYAQLVLLPDLIPSAILRRFPYVKPGEENSGDAFSIERPINSCEVRAAKYLAVTIGKETKTSPVLSSDMDLQDRLDISFVAFGGPFSNYKTRDVINNSANNLLSFDNAEFTSSRTGKVVLRIQHKYDYGLILKIHPTQFPDRTWFICGGLGEWGTSGAAWYLAKRWRDIQMFAGDSTFGIIVRVKPKQDESAEAVVKVKSESDVAALEV
jgi:hypothetical protein